MWKADGPQGFESDKIATLVVPYTRGKGLDVGCGQRKVWPHVIGVDNGHHNKMFGHQKVADIDGDGSDLKIFSDNSLDFVFSSHTLEHFPEDQVDAVLAEWSRVIKTGGYLVLYLPSANLYPKVGEKNANPDHKWNIYPGDAERKLLAATKCGWTQLECEERGHSNKDDEYSLYEVYQKRDDGEFVKKLWERNPEGKKRCLVIRYGAIGDLLISSSILPGLKKQGYHVTFNAESTRYDVIKHDPNVDEFMLQDSDQVPNTQLGAYWETLKISGRYDKIINLCESLEGSLLTLNGRLTNEYSHEARHKIFNVNYLERTHDIAGVPHKFAQKFYPTEEERAESRAEYEKHVAPVILWALNGSSVHKVYPWTQVVVAWLIERTPAHIYFSGDKDGKMLQDAIFRELKASGVKTDRIHGIASEWSIRKTLSFAQTVDCVVGPETGVLNSVALDDDVAKVVYLSHSSIENLTKHWRNTKSLTPEQSRCPCYPCHRLHHGWNFCNKNEETAAAQCASSISAERVFGTIAKSLIKQVEKTGKVA